MHNEEIENILKDKRLTETELIFKSNVKKLRKNSPGSPTLVEMAALLGMTYGAYRIIESPTHLNVKFETMEKIAKFHNIPVSDLFKL